MNTENSTEKKPEKGSPLSLLQSRGIEYLGDLGNTEKNEDGEEFLILHPETSEDQCDENRRMRYETAYPQVSVLFDEETVRAMNWKDVFGF